MEKTTFGEPLRRQQATVSGVPAALSSGRAQITRQKGFHTCTNAAVHFITLFLLLLLTHARLRV